MDRTESLLTAKLLASTLGLPWQLPRHSTIVSYKVTDETVSITLEVFEVEESVRDDKFVKKGMRMLVWTEVFDFTVDNGQTVATKDGSLREYKYQSMTVWDTDFTPYVEHKVGRIETPAEYTARRNWEAEQYRVGSSRSPMDNAQRVTEGFTTDKMTAHWNKA